MSGKPFRTFKEQIQILKERNLNFENENDAEIILSKVNYYNIINGYKIPFLQKNLNGQILTPERYINNCKFEELYCIYEMDRKLRIILIEYLLKFENALKTTIAYYFSEKYREEYSYLNVSNYSKNPSDINMVLKNIAALSNGITNNNKSNSDRRYIPHYIENHENVPLWVLVNSLTIGNISYFYNSLDELKEKIARKFGEEYMKDYSSKEKITYSELSNIIKIVNYFRNVCAHDEVLLLYKLRKPIKTSIFHKYFSKININGENLYDLICLLKLVISKLDYAELIENIDNLFKKYESCFSSVEFDKIIELAGFKSSWKSDLL